MKKSRFNLLVISSVIVLVAIVAVQAYWVDHTATYHKKRFDRRVRKAMDSVVSKLEASSAVSRISNPFENSSVPKYKSESEGSPFLRQLTKNFESTFNVQKMTNGSHKDSAETGHYQVDVRHKQKDDSSIMIVKQSQKRVYQLQRNPEAAKASNQEGGTASEMGEGPILYNNVVNEISFISIDQEREHAIDFRVLDSIIKRELESKEIYISAISDIMDAQTGKLAFHENSGLREEIINSSYKIELFQNNYLIDSDVLILYFPDRPQLFREAIWKTLVFSILLILVLTGLIYTSLTTILKQKKLDAVKSDFISNMTHELKTPIATISLACEALRDPKVKLSTEKQAAYLKMISDENKRLYSMVDTVLKSAVWDQPGFALDKTAFFLQDLVEEVTNSFRIQVEKKGGTLTTEFAEKEHKVFADKVHFANLIYNLLDNANKYSDKKPNILVKVHNIGEDIELAIADEGIGIPEEHKKKIFDKFYRVPTGDVHNIKGFGLGLSYVKSIVEKHGGTIIIHSQVGKGTTCRIRIPIYK